MESCEKKPLGLTDPSVKWVRPRPMCFHVIYLLHWEPSGKTSRGLRKEYYKDFI